MGKLFRLILLVLLLLPTGLKAQQSQSGNTGRAVDAREKHVWPVSDPKNPKAKYPAMSLRLGEEGRVIVDVTVADDGSVLDAKIDTSSGFDRLDHAAVETVLRSWRFVPGSVGGVPQKMEAKVALSFKLSEAN
jgi:TonB family protein